jgi:hypothetical protein
VEELTNADRHLGVGHLLRSALKSPLSVNFVQLGGLSSNSDRRATTAARVNVPISDATVEIRIGTHRAYASPHDTFSVSQIRAAFKI